MGRTVLYIAVSLDGYVAGEDDDISWLLPYSDVDYGFDAFFATIGAIIQGRRAYEIERRNGWEYAHPLPTFVLSHRPPDAPTPPGVRFTAEAIESVLEQARRLSPGDVWVEGGAQVARQFLQRRLLDDLIITVVPIVLGRGIPLFMPTPQRIPLALREVRRFDKGLVQLHYTPAAP